MSPVEDIHGVFRVHQVMGEVTELGRDDKRVPVKPSKEFLHHVGVKVSAGAFLGLVENLTRKQYFGFNGFEEGAIIEHNTFEDGEVGSEIAQPEQFVAGQEGIYGGIKFKVT